MATEVVKIEVFGLLNDINFVRSKCCAEDLYTKDPSKFLSPAIHGMVEFEWDLFIEAKKKELRGEMWSFDEKAIAFINGQFFGGPGHFIIWAEDTYGFEEFRPEPLYQTLTEEGYMNTLNSRNHDFVYFDICINGQDAGRIVIELFSDIAPKTCANFKSLCIGPDSKSEDAEGSEGAPDHEGVDPPEAIPPSEGITSSEDVQPSEGVNGSAGDADPDQIKLTYKNSIFHRIVRKGWIQGGDICHGYGNGGESIYGPVFEDENFAVSHNRRGMVSMANKGRHTNGSQFFITLEPTTWMDTKFVVFGQVIEGTKTLQMMESQETMNERPVVDITITDCGVNTYEF